MSLSFRTGTPIDLEMDPGVTLRGEKWQWPRLMPCSADTTPGADTYRTRNAGITDECEVFLGVRYGVPPVGPRRFHDADLFEYPPGVHEVQTFAAVPFQDYPLEEGSPGRFETGNDGLYEWDGYEAEETEDCLRVHIYKPSGPISGRPVYVWIHGGGWDVNSACNYPVWGNRMAAKGIIVVSVEYRLGLFGHTFHPDFKGEEGWDSPGYAHTDHILALQWVQEHISKFGGDPNRVTIDGTSAGGASVTCLLEDPRAHGLFWAASSRSGGSIGQRHEAGPGPTKFGYEKLCSMDLRVLKAVSHVTKDLTGQYGSLREAFERRGDAYALRNSVPPEVLLKTHTGINYFPWRDGVHLTHDSAADAALSGAFPDVPVMWSVCENEASLIGAQTVTDTISIAPHGYASLLGFAGWAEMQSTDFFPDTMSLSERFRALYSLAVFWAAAYIQAREHSRRGNPSYLFLWNYKSDGNGLHFANHSADAAYVFGNISWQVGQSSTETLIYNRDLYMSEIMMQMTINFCATRDPNDETIYAGSPQPYATPPSATVTRFEAPFWQWTLQGSATSDARGAPATFSPVTGRYSEWCGEAWERLAEPRLEQL